MDYDVKPGSKVGDNFACVMLAIEASARLDGGRARNTTSWPSTPMNSLREKFVKEGHIFDKECLVYGELYKAYTGACHYESQETQVFIV